MTHVYVCVYLWGGWGVVCVCVGGGGGECGCGLVGEYVGVCGCIKALIFWKESH